VSLEHREVFLHGFPHCPKCFARLKQLGGHVPLVVKLP
jgi:hypothetical protein